MRYEATDQYKLRIIPEGKDITEILLAIAKHSYDTAVPRGLGELQPHQAPSLEVDLETCIEKDRGGNPIMLLMNYINGRDCRTKAYLDRDGQWYFDAYAFQQRKVTGAESARGIIRDNAEGFLTEVALQLRKGHN
ncbi:TPA: hypothetical protein HA246_07180 [Candidatus Woesearchaeota archaeon]|nr:hypothetical protein [Candidatus Woesearchaeota archaeon]